MAVATNAACGVTAEPDEAAPELAASAVPPGMHRVRIVFTGSGAGRLEVFAGSTYLRRCQSTCHVDVPDGAQVIIDVYAPSQFVGFTGACASDFQCVFTADANATVNAEFEFDDREVATLLPDVAINGVAFAADGNLIAATETGVSKYRLDGKIAWTLPIDGGANAVATDNTGRIYAGSSTTLFAMSPGGAVLWTQPIGVDAPEHNLYSYMGGLQVTPDGSTVAVRTSTGAATFRRNGTPRFQTADGAPDGWALAPDGSVAFGVADDVEPGTLDLRRYSPAGVLTSPPGFAFSNEHASLAFAPNGDLGVMSGPFGHNIGVYAPDLTGIWGARTGLHDFTAPHGLAFDASNNLVAVYTGDAGTTIAQYSPTGEILFETAKIASSPFGFPPIPFALASDRGKRIAVAGEINFQPWISVYQLP